MNPSIGRFVHYKTSSASDGIKAAIITGVNADGSVSLYAFNRPGAFDWPNVPYSDKQEVGHWFWPPRVDGK